MLEKIDFAAIWQGSHRGKLHESSSWSSSCEPSLTYVPTGAGFTGATQLHRFVGLFPAADHPLYSEQLTRYNNDYRVVSCAVDAERRVVTEELVISSLHACRIDYLMPGVNATNLTFTMTIVLVAQYAEDGLLEACRVYWDHATLLRQLGVFHLAFHNLIRAAGKAATFENEIDQIPIVDGVKIAQRLLRPTGHNCNPIMSLEWLEVNAAKLKSDSDHHGIRLSPIGGLDNITELAHNLPNVSPKRQQAAKHGPALSSSIFSPIEELAAPHSAHVSHPNAQAAFASNSVFFGDGSNEPTQPVMKGVPKASIFGEQHDVAVHRPSITVDPMRNVSKVFMEPSSPFHPSVPLADRSRFDSKIFSNSPLATPSAPVKVNTQLQSHVFEVERPRVAPKPASCAIRPSPFGADDEQPIQAATSSSEHRHFSSSQKSHFSGSSFGFTEQAGSTPPSFSGRRGDPHSNRSSIRFTDVDDADVPRAAAVNPRAASHNQSQLQLGDNPTLPTLHTSTRVLQPPGGHSTIFRD